MRTVPYAVVGIVTFTAGWFVAPRFGRPVGIPNRPPWLTRVNVKLALEIK